MRKSVIVPCWNEQWNMDKRSLTRERTRVRPGDGEFCERALRRLRIYRRRRRRRGLSCRELRSIKNMEKYLGDWPGCRVRGLKMSSERWEKSQWLIKRRAYGWDEVFLVARLSRIANENLPRGIIKWERRGNGWIKCVCFLNGAWRKTRPRLVFFFLFSCKEKILTVWRYLLFVRRRQRLTTNREKDLCWMLNVKCLGHCPITKERRLWEAAEID